LCHVSRDTRHDNTNRPGLRREQPHTSPMKDLLSKENLINLAMIAIGSAIGVVILAPLFSGWYAKLKSKAA
jgi:hypothetical protein